MDAREPSVGILQGGAVAGEMLGASEHPLFLQGFRKDASQFRNDREVIRERPYVYYRVSGLGIHVKNRGKGKIEAAVLHLPGGYNGLES